VRIDCAETESLVNKIFATALVAVATFGAGAAHASNVHWSIGINVPAPVYYEPAPVYYQPAPVYVEPAPVYVRPYVVPGPVIYGSGYYGYRHHHHHWRDHGDWRGNQIGYRGQWAPVPADPRRYRHDYGY